MTTPKVKTLFLYDNHTGDEPVFFELEGDYSRLDGVYINDSDSAVELTDELNTLLYTDDGEFKPTKLDEPTRDWTYFVRCGFLG